MAPRHTREQWLLQAVDELRPLFKGVDAALPDTVHVSVGFPSRGVMSARRRSVGQCWDGSASADRNPHVFIHPELDGPRALDTLTHELVHAAVGNGCGHKGAFKRAALAVGLTGKMTATVAGDELKDRFTRIIKRIGEYPHAVLTAKGRTKQGTRLILLLCQCGRRLRVSKKVLDEGTINCGLCDGPFKQAE